jgi:dihydrofolate reductase
MQKLSVFNHISLDGYFVDRSGAMNWAKAGNADPEWNEFVAANASGDGTLLFGRVTYELMIRYWPTPMAREHDPAVADRMNSLRKVVFSRTLSQASWSNTTLVRHDLPGEVGRMKQTLGEGLVILGSGTIVSQLTEAGLIDEYQVVVNPVILGGGRTMFDSVTRPLSLRRTRCRAFGNGKVFVSYEPIA